MAPQIGSISFGEEPLNAGDATSLTCSVIKGDSPLEITWMFNNEPLPSSDLGVIVTETGKRTKQLTIDFVSARHAGEYTCVASNIAGSTSRSATLTVNGTMMNVLHENMFFYLHLNKLLFDPSLTLD